MNLFRCCAALAAFLGALCLAADDVSPWDLWRQGYTSFEKGESARDRGDHVQALEHFRAAVKSYRAVQKARPSWNQNVINSRIMLCEQEIADAKKLLGRSSNEAPSRQTARETAGGSDAPETGGRRTATRPRGDAETLASELVKMQAELAQYKQKLYSTLVELEDLRRQAARGKNAAAEMENMLRERRVAEEKYRLLEARCKDLEAKTSRPSGELAEANRKLVEMRINLETGERKLELARSREQNQIRENAELLRERDELKSKLELSGRKLADSEKEAESLRDIRSRAAQEKNATLQKAAELEKQLAAARDQLKGREEQLATLDRRLQEAVKSKGASAALSSEIAAENERLRKQASDAYKASESSAAEARALQNQLRESRIAMDRLNATIRNLDDRRTQALSEVKVMQEQVEKVTADRKLAAAENANLAARSRKLEEDVRELSDQLDRMKKRLAVRDSADRAAAETLAGERTRLADQVSALKLKVAEAKVDAEAHRKRLEAVSNAAAELRAEYLKTKAQALSAEQEIKRSADVAAERDRLKQDLATLQRNFAALQIEKTDLQKVKQQYETQLPELERLRKTAARIDEIERQNQEFSDRNAKLSRRTEAAEAASAQLRRQRDEALAGTAKAQQELAAAESAALVLRRQNITADKQRETWRKTRGELETRLAEVQKSRDELETRLAAEQKTRGEAEARLANDRNIRTELEKRAADTERKLAAAEERRAETERKLAAAREQRTETARKLADAEQRRIAAEQQNAGLQSRIADKERRIAELTRNSAPAGKSGAGTPPDDAARRAELARIEQEKLQADKEIRTAREQLAKLRAEAEKEAQAEKENIAKLRAEAEQAAKTEKERIAKLRTDTAKETQAEESRLAKLRAEAEQAAKTEKERIAKLRRSAETEAEKVRLKRIQAETEAEKVRIARLQADTEAEQVRLKRQKEATAQANLELRRQMDAAVAAAQSAARTAAPSSAAAASVQTTLPAAEKLTPVQVAKMTAAAARAEKEESPKVARWNYRKILESEPANFDANFGMGRLELAEEEYARAAVYLQQAHIAREARPDVRIAYARALLGQRKYGNALALLDGCPPAARKRFDWQYARGRALAGSGRTQQARSALLSAHRLEPKNGQVLLELAKLPVAPRDDAAKMRAAKWYERAKKLGVTPDPALEKSLGKLINERAELIDFMSGAALEAEKHRDWNSAVWYYRQLRDLDPESGFYAERAARYNFLQKKYADALQMLTDRPATPRGEWLRAASLLGSGRTAEAEKAAAALREIKPDSDLAAVLKTLNDTPIRRKLLAAANEKEVPK